LPFIVTLPGKRYLDFKSPLKHIFGKQAKIHCTKSSKEKILKLGAAYREKYEIFSKYERDRYEKNQ